MQKVPGLLPVSSFTASPLVGGFPVPWKMRTLLMSETRPPTPVSARSCLRGRVCTDGVRSVGLLSSQYDRKKAQQQHQDLVDMSRRTFSSSTRVLNSPHRPSLHTPQAGRLASRPNPLLNWG